ncbi:MAG: hypothetical protein RIC38_03680, partial [Chromatocurvus sp.]
GQLELIMQETYNIYFSGDIADGESLEDVRRKIGALFNARDATLDKLFSGRTQLIKRNCSQEEALTYKAAMQRAGALATITPADTAAKPADDAPEKASSPEPTATTVAAGTPAQDTAPLSLAPTGTDVLLPAERQEMTQRDMDLSAFTMAPAGERLGAPAADAPPPPDTSHLSAADIGDALPTLAAPAPPPPPDTSTLTLAEAATDLLEERYRNHDIPPPPETDHLSMELPDND